MISKLCDNGKYQIIELLKGQTLLGVRSILNGEYSNLQATALTDVEGCLVPKALFFDTLKNNHEFALFVLQSLAHYIKKTDDKLADFGQKNLQQRTAKLLLEMEDFFPKKENGYICLHLKRDEMANLIGIANESLIRTLSAFQKKNWIKVSGRKVCLLDKKSLEAVVQGF